MALIDREGALQTSFLCPHQHSQEYKETCFWNTVEEGDNFYLCLPRPFIRPRVCVLCVSRTGVWTRNWIHCTFSTPNYRSLQPCLQFTLCGLVCRLLKHSSSNGFQRRTFAPSSEFPNFLRASATATLALQ
jgi:hypothetical protein